MTVPFIDRLRSELLEGAPRYHAGRRRRRAIVATTAVVVTGVGVGVLLLGSDNESGSQIATEGPSSTAEPDTSQPEPATTTTGDREPSDLDAGEAAAAKATVDEFIDHLRHGEIEAAAALWSGYPATSPDDTAAIVAATEQFVTDFEWLVTTPSYEAFVTPSFGLTTATPVVTVVSDPALDADPDQRNAAAFVVGSPIGEPSQPDAHVQIHRLPEASSGITPPPGTTITPGQRVVLSRVPVEGGAIAHVDGTEVTAIVNHDDLTTSVEIPTSLGGEVVLTVSFATPEVPATEAVWYSVAPS